MGKPIVHNIVNLFVKWLNKETPLSDYAACDFDRICYEIRLCDVLLIEGRSRVSEVIKSVTQSAWSHSALYIGRISDIENENLRNRIREFYPGKDDEQLMIESLLGQGSVISPIKNYANDHVRICRPTGLSRHDAQKVIGYAIGKLGRDYDIRQTFDLFRLLYPWSILPRKWRSTIFQRNPSETTREICSSLIADAFNCVHFPILPYFKHDAEKGTKLFKRNPRLYTPRDFDYSPFFEIIKYPILEITEHALYHHLPWESDSYSNDEGDIVKFNEVKEQKDNIKVTLPTIKLPTEQNHYDDKPSTSPPETLTETTEASTSDIPAKLATKHSPLAKKKSTDKTIKKEDKKSKKLFLGFKMKKKEKNSEY